MEQLEVKSKYALVMPLPAGWFHVPLKGAGRVTARQRWQAVQQRPRDAHSRELSSDKHAQAASNAEPAVTGALTAPPRRNRATSYFTESSEDSEAEATVYDAAGVRSAPLEVAPDGAALWENAQHGREGTAIRDAKMWAIQRQSRVLKLAAERERERKLMTRKTSFHTGGSTAAGYHADDMRGRSRRSHDDYSSSSEDDSQLLARLDLVEQGLATAPLLTSIASGFLASGAIPTDCPPDHYQCDPMNGGPISPARITNVSPPSASFASGRSHMGSCSTPSAVRYRPSAAARAERKPSKGAPRTVANRAVHHHDSRLVLRRQLFSLVLAIIGSTDRLLDLPATATRMTRARQTLVADLTTQAGLMSQMWEQARIRASQSR